MRKLQLALLLVIMLLYPAGAAENSSKTAEVTLQLVAEGTGIQPGVPFTVGIHLAIAPGWHVYWLNPGDAGLPITVEWQLPQGFTAGELQWPYPHRIDFGGLINFGYEDEVLLQVEITPPANPGSDPVTLAAAVDWLVCKEACVPQSGQVALSLPVSEKGGPNAAWVEAFAKGRALLPLQSSEWRFQATVHDTTLTLLATPPANFEGPLQEMTFFPSEADVIDNVARQRFSAAGGIYRLDVALITGSAAPPANVTGVLVSDGWRGSGTERAIQIAAPVQDIHLAPLQDEADKSGIGSIWWALISAFLGGIILNVMPCVLPVISLKILGFVKQAGESRQQLVKHGLAFTVGVLASFWVLAGLLILLQKGGEELGWGFHLQSPAFVVLLSVFLFLFGLSLFGVFEIGTSLMGVGQGGAPGGMFGSFMSGVTATVVATPCTAPFMGAALGFALSQPALISLLIFTFLGLGMAAPYMLLSSIPGLLKFVPKPGAWMESLKQFMGFLLMATVVWLLSVLGQQSGLTSVLLLLVTLVIAAMGAWVLGRWGSIMQEAGTRRIAQTAAILLIAGGTWMYFALNNTTSKISWQTFSPELVASLLEEGTPVFVDFTASWCLSCQANKKFVIESDNIAGAFERYGVTAVIADWTSRDESITRALANFGRNSVPLYVLYSGKPGEEPQILPEILTQDIVLEALEKLN